MINFYSYLTIIIIELEKNHNNSKQNGLIFCITLESLSEYTYLNARHSFKSRNCQHLAERELHLQVWDNPSLIFQRFISTKKKNNIHSNIIKFINSLFKISLVRFLKAILETFWDSPCFTAITVRYVFYN